MSGGGPVSGARAGRAGGREGGPERRRESFPSGLRLRRRVDFLAVQNRGRRLAGTHLLLFADAGPGRFGVTVSRKVGGAVVRNRVKRWIRECFRRGARSRLPEGYDVVVVARPAAARAGYETVCRELSTLAGRLRGPR